MTIGEYAFARMTLPDAGAERAVRLHAVAGQSNLAYRQARWARDDRLRPCAEACFAVSRGFACAGVERHGIAAHLDHCVGVRERAGSQSGRAVSAVIGEVRRFAYAHQAVVRSSRRASGGSGRRMPRMFHRTLDAHQLAFALGEALVHLHKLGIDGILLHDMAAEGIIRFKTR